MQYRTAGWIAAIFVSGLASGCGSQDVGPTARSGPDAAVEDAADAAEEDAAEEDAPAATCDGAGERFATDVVEHEFGPGQDAGRDEFPAVVTGGPRGAGCCAGSLHTTSLGNGGWVVLRFGANEIVDGPGPDFIVSENAFHPGGDESSVFAELATVAVSTDGQAWVEFPCTAVAAPFGACAGHTPVFANVDTNQVDPFDPEAAGGDAFDLADLGVESARYVRIADRPDLDSSFDGVFDLDAVTIVNARCP